MQVTIVQWRNLASNVQLVLGNPDVSSMAGRLDFLKAMLELCNWGEALTNAAIAHAELLRDAMQKRLSLSSKLQQAARYGQYVAQLASGTMTKQQMTAAMAEQLLDIRTDLNNILFSFCQVQIRIQIF